MQPYQQGPAGLDRIRYLDQFFVQQRFAPVANLYLISTVGPDGRSAGELLGTVRKAFGASLLRSSWSVLDAAGVEVATARESSMFIAILRRIWSSIPYLGDVPFLLPFHFDLHAPDGRQIGRYTRMFALRDRYVLDLSGDPERRLDRRVAMAFTVALDALQDR